MNPVRSRDRLNNGNKPLMDKMNGRYYKQIILRTRVDRDLLRTG